MNRKLFTTILPLLLFCLFAVVALLITFKEANNYNFYAVDEGFQDQYGQLSLSWYKTHGSDTRFMTTFDPKTYMPQHGPAFEVIVAEAQHKFGQPLYTRTLVTGLAGFAGILAMALCGFEMGGWWGALLAALGLWLYPRFVGTMFSNSKDVPFASSMVFVLWSVLLLVRHWGKKWVFLPISCLVGILIGFATSIRVNGILWYPMLGCLLVGWWIYYGRDTLKKGKVAGALVKQASAIGIIVGVSFITMIVCWPYIALNPLHNLIDAIIINSKYPWGGTIDFNGHAYLATKLPRIYVPEWLAIGSPPATILLAIIGILIIGLTLIKKRAIHLQALVIALVFFIPLGALLVLHPTLYNAMRQFLFITPPLILLAVYGFMSLFDYLRQRKQTLGMIALVLVVLASQLLVVKDIVDLYPYEYTYFSPFVGGTRAAAGKYETDYEALCTKASTDWLALNYKQYTSDSSPTITTSIGSGMITPSDPPIFKARNMANPDFYIGVSQTNTQTYKPSYKVIHTVEIEGFVVCTVETK
jgi:4-amino-4-deoxy-L-arabinose transferase-like glycosyltransferase